MLRVLLGLLRRKRLFVLICVATFLLIHHQWRSVETSEVDRTLRNAILNALKPAHPQKEKKDALQRLHRKVQNAIRSLQEPEDGCNGTTKVLVCRNDFGQAGFGSIAHRYAPCLQIAFGLGRVAVWNHEEYAHFGGYSRWMKPPTKACAHLRDKKFSDGFKARFNIKNKTLWNDNFTVLADDAKYLFLDIRFSFPYPRHVPGTLPQYLEVALLEIGVEFPWKWFYSQFMYYMIGRPNDYFTKVFEDVKSELSFSHPCIGVHIRQDPEKVRDESTFIATKNYSEAALHIYDNYIPDYADKKIYVASDVRANFKRLERLVPGHYRVLSLPRKYRKFSINKYFTKNFNPGALESILLEVYFLWNSDFIVCMHSSNVCRLMEELKYATTAFLDGRTVYSLYQDYYCDFPGYKEYIKYLLTTGDKPSSCHKCMNYSRGQLFAKVKHFSVFNDDFVEVESGKLRGLIRRNDLVSWPGRPYYETHVDLF